MEELIALALLALFGKKKREAQQQQQQQPAQLPDAKVARVAAIVSTRLTSGTNVPSARVVDDIVRLLKANPALAAKLAIVYSDQLQGTDQAEDGERGA